MTQVNNVKTLDQQFTDETGIDVSKKVRGVNLDPVVGMGVTRSIGSDSYPYTILTVKDKTILKIQQDHTLYIKKQDGRRARDIEYLEQFRNHGLDGRIEYKDIKWNEQTKRWNKGCSYYYASVGQRHYDLDRGF